MSHDRRQSRTRATHLCEAQLDGVKNTWDTVRVSDIGPGGASLDTRSTLPVGSTLRLAFRIRKTEVTVMAQVVYCTPPVGIGVRFLDLSPEDRALIEVLKRDLAR